MSGTKSKKVVGKDDLRKLMKQQQFQKSANNNNGSSNSNSGSAAQAARINSPLAKYNSLGQLSCVVCGCQIKSELLWSAHILGRAHKENVARLKTEGGGSTSFAVPAPPSSSSGGILKRKAADDESNGTSAKVSRVNTSIPHSTKSSNNNSSSVGLPSDFFDTGSGSSRVKPSTSHGSQVKSSNTVTSLAQYDDDSDEEDDDDKNKNASTSNATNSGLPSDFFDNSANPSTSTSQTSAAETNSKSTAAMKEQLPEGFFDDPMMDAKVRQVEYRDKMEDEWESFQKTMKEESIISEVLVEEDDDQRDAERSLEQIDDQINRWSKVDKLQKRKDTIMSSIESSAGGSSSKGRMKEEGMELDDDDEDDDVEQLLDWRSKAV